MTSYPSFWLRDHAKDPLSFDSKSQQRELFTAKVNPEIVPLGADISTDGESVLIHWPGLPDPVHYSGKFLREFIQPRNQLDVWNKVIWDANSITEDSYLIEWSQFLQDDGLARLMARITENGFALMRGCPTNFDTVQQIASQIGYVRHTIFGGSSSGGGGATSASKILVIGDSIGAGYGLAVPYPVRIQQSTGATLINDSADGRVTSEVLHG